MAARISSTTLACPPAPTPTIRVGSEVMELLDEEAIVELCGLEHVGNAWCRVAVTIGIRKLREPGTKRLGARHLESTCDLIRLGGDVKNVGRSDAPSLAIADIDRGESKRGCLDDARRRVSNHRHDAAEKGEVGVRAEAAHEREALVAGQSLDPLDDHAVKGIRIRIRQNSVEAAAINGLENRVDLTIRVATLERHGMKRYEQRRPA